ADAEFCKFCGARYTDAPSAAGAPPPANATLNACGAGGATVATPALVARLVSIRKDGSDGEVFPVMAPHTDIGRSEGDVVLPDDPYLSPRHARIRTENGRFHLRDLGSVNGTFQRLRDAVTLEDGDRVLIGQQLLRFERVEDAERPLGPASVQGVLAFGTPEVPRYARLVQYTTEGVGRDVHYLYRDETVLGRETGDVVFTDDPFLSRRHASITLERGTQQVVLKDLGSSNGTSIGLRTEVEIQAGDCIRVGRHLFRFDVAEGEGQR
ncbi:MAG: FHA domain-containing protein, partial [Myxococcota bacterium]